MPRPGKVDRDLDASQCPGGCKIVDGMGTCSEIKRQTWKWCSGYYAFVCPTAMTAWLAAGRPAVTFYALQARERREVFEPPRPAPLPVKHPPPRYDGKEAASGEPPFNPDAEDP